MYLTWMELKPLPPMWWFGPTDQWFLRYRFRRMREYQMAGQCTFWCKVQQGAPYTCIHTFMFFIADIVCWRNWWQQQIFACTMQSFDLTYMCVIGNHPSHSYLLYSRDTYLDWVEGVKARKEPGRNDATIVQACTWAWRLQATTWTSLTPSLRLPVKVLPGGLTANFRNYSSVYERSELIPTWRNHTRHLSWSKIMLRSDTQVEFDVIIMM